MRYFVLPFTLSIPLAAPLLWYHLDGLDPVDIAVQSPSQEEIDFADTRERLSTPGTQAYGPSQYSVSEEDSLAESDKFFRTAVSTPPGY